ncbi:hypothetical protein MRX96_037418 [Rhipicephalus microplus]
MSQPFLFRRLSRRKSEGHQDRGSEWRNAIAGTPWHTPKTITAPAGAKPTSVYEWASARSTRMTLSVEHVGAACGGESELYRGGGLRAERGKRDDSGV